MTTRNFFWNWFSKQTVKKDANSEENSDHDLQKDPEVDENASNTKRLFRSRSGRLKDVTKKRLPIAQDTFVAPIEGAKISPVISSTELHYPGRELTTLESSRLNRSLQWITISRGDDKEHEISKDNSNLPVGQTSIQETNEIF